MLTGDRVVLRPLRPSDVEPLWRVRLDPVTWAQTSEAPVAWRLVAVTSEVSGPLPSCAAEPV